MSEDIIDRLRGWGADGPQGDRRQALMNDAAEEIARLRAETVSKEDYQRLWRLHETQCDHTEQLAVQLQAAQSAIPPAAPSASPKPCENFIYEDVIASRQGNGPHRFVPEPAAPSGEREAVADETMRVLVEAAIPLEVLAAQIKQKRYAELSADFQEVVLKTVDLIRTHVSGAGNLIEVDCNCRHPGSLGGDCDGSCVQTGIPGRVLVAAQPAEERAVMDAANHIETAPVPVKRMMPSEVKNRDREIAAEIREMAALDRARAGSEVKS